MTTLNTNVEPAQAPKSLEPSASEGEKKPAEIPKLDPAMSVQFEDGTQATLGEMAQALAEKKAGGLQPQISAERMGKFELFEKAMDTESPGQPQALRELTSLIIPEKAPEETPDPASVEGRLSAAQQEISELKKSVAQSGEVSGAIVNAANVQHASQLITAAKEKFPWLAAHPSGAAKLVKRIEETNVLAVQQKVNPSDPAMAQKIQDYAFTSLNQEIEAEVKPFGGSVEGAAAKPGGKPPIQVVDDQQRKDRMLINEHGIQTDDYDDGRRFGSEGLSEDVPAIRARFALNTMGQLFERSSEQLMANPQNAQQNRPIEGDMLGGTAQGKAAFVEQGRVGMGELRRQLRARQEEVGG